MFTYHDGKASVYYTSDDSLSDVVKQVEELFDRLHAKANQLFSKEREGNTNFCQAILAIKAHYIMQGKASPDTKNKLFGEQRKSELERIVFGLETKVDDEQARDFIKGFFLHDNGASFTSSCLPGVEKRLEEVDRFLRKITSVNFEGLFAPIKEEAFQGLAGEYIRSNIKYSHGESAASHQVHYINAVLDLCAEKYGLPPAVDEIYYLHEMATFEKQEQHKAAFEQFLKEKHVDVCVLKKIIAHYEQELQAILRKKEFVAQYKKTDLTSFADLESFFVTLVNALGKIYPYTDEDSKALIQYFAYNSVESGIKSLTFLLQAEVIKQLKRVKYDFEHFKVNSDSKEEDSELFISSALDCCFRSSGVYSIPPQEMKSGDLKAVILTVIGNSHHNDEKAIIHLVEQLVDQDEKEDLSFFFEEREQDTGKTHYEKILENGWFALATKILQKSYLDESKKERIISVTVDTVFSQRDYNDVSSAKLIYELLKKGANVATVFLSMLHAKRLGLAAETLCCFTLSEDSQHNSMWVEGLNVVLGELEVSQQIIFIQILLKGNIDIRLFDIVGSDGKSCYEKIKGEDYSDLVNQLDNLRKIQKIFDKNLDLSQQLREMIHNKELDLVELLFRSEHLTQAQKNELADIVLQHSFSKNIDWSVFLLEQGVDPNKIFLSIINELPYVFFSFSLEGLEKILNNDKFSCHLTEETLTQSLNSVLSKHSVDSTQDFIRKLLEKGADIDGLFWPEEKTQRSIAICKPHSNFLALVKDWLKEAPDFSLVEYVLEKINLKNMQHRHHLVLMQVLDELIDQVSFSNPKRKKEQRWKIVVKVLIMGISVSNEVAETINEKLTNMKYGTYDKNVRFDILTGLLSNPVNLSHQNLCALIKTAENEISDARFNHDKLLSAKEKVENLKHAVSQAKTFAKTIQHNECYEKEESLNDLLGIVRQAFFVSRWGTVQHLEKLARKQGDEKPVPAAESELEVKKFTLAKNLLRSYYVNSRRWFGWRQHKAEVESIIETAESFVSLMQMLAAISLTNCIGSLVIMRLALAKIQHAEDLSQLVLSRPGL
jgi:hypothetical protein